MQSVTPLTLYPYTRATYRSILGVLWQRMDREGATAKVFHATPGPERGDLIEFVRYFDDAKRHLLMAVEDEEPRGLVWFDDVVPGHRAAINIWYTRRVWGERSRATTAQAITWAFNALAVPTLWAYTPWHTAVRHGTALGFRVVAVLPGFARIDDAVRDLTILRLEREAWA